MYWVIILITIITAIYWKLTRDQYYWKRKGVKQGNPTLLLGDNWGLFKKDEPFSEFSIKLYNRFPEDRYSGVYQFNSAFLLIRDPELIRQITVKDFEHFTDHMKFIPENVEPLWNKNLIALKGEPWRHMRTTLSPSFTSSKMRGMFEMMSNCAERFSNYFLEENEDVVTVEFKDSFTRYGNDIIASCAFGIECDSMGQKDNEFYKNVKELTNFKGFLVNLKFIFVNIVPKLFQLFGIRIFDKKSHDYFSGIIKEAIQIREKQNIQRPDMIHLMLEARKGRLQYEESAAKETGFATVEESSVGINTKVQKKEITIDDMTAQALIFFFAGFETVSILMCFMGYELAANPDCQEKLREEVDETLRECNGKLTYEALNKMKYMDMCTTETLRKWPPVMIGDRVCTKTYTIQPTKPTEKPVTLNKGDSIWLPVYGLHHDPQYYEEPEKFIPERFSDENKANVKPYTYLPFGVGPRNCIGSRFALMESKALFFHLLSKFEIVPVEKTKIPIELDMDNFNLHSAGGFWFGLKKRNV